MINIFPVEESDIVTTDNMCFCCTSDSDVKEIRFQLFGACGKSVKLCKACRKDLREKLFSLDAPKISVGDEVYVLDRTDRSVVTALDGDSCVILTCRGKFSVIKQKNLKRTGRHFPVAEFLQKLEGVLE